MYNWKHGYTFIKIKLNIQTLTLNILKMCTAIK